MPRGWTMKHVLSLPAGPGPHPLLCFLHGFDEAAPQPLEEALRRHGPLRGGNPPQATEAFMVLAPQLPVGGDLWHRHAGKVLTLVEEAIARYGADPGQLYLTGFSFGGNGVFDLALMQGPMWAALWPVDPTRVPARDPGLPVWLSVGEVARPQKRRFIEQLRLEPAGEAASGDRLYVDRGDDHVGAARRAYADERVYAWLLEHRHETPGVMP